MKVIIRADALPELGGGHIMRCLTLANQLAKKGTKIAFAVREGSVETVPKLSKSGHKLIVIEGPEQDEAQEIEARIGKCDWLIVDHYSRNTEFETTARNFANKIMVIDDLADRPHDCDILLDQTYGRKADDYLGLVPEQSRLLMGTDYALLRPEFARLRPEALERRKQGGPVRRILVSLGASDPHGMISNVLQATEMSDLDVSLDVVKGVADPEAMGLMKIAETMPQSVTFHDFDADMAELMFKADLAIGAGGVTSWERCCLGLPTLMIVMADNQEKTARELKAMGAVQLLGNTLNLKKQDILKGMSVLANDSIVLGQMALNAAGICGGLGASRTAQVLILPVKIKEGGVVDLRSANKGDGDWLFELQSIPETRRFFRNPQSPEREQHFRWLADRLRDPACHLLVITLDGHRAGYVRADYRGENETHEISIAVDPAFQRQGIGRIALELLRNWMPDAVFIAEAMPENHASCTLFLSARFHREDKLWFVSKPKTK